MFIHATWKDGMMNFETSVANKIHKLCIAEVVDETFLCLSQFQGCSYVAGSTNHVTCPV